MWPGGRTPRVRALPPVPADLDLLAVQAGRPCNRIKGADAGAEFHHDGARPPTAPPRLGSLMSGRVAESRCTEPRGRGNWPSGGSLTLGRGQPVGELARRRVGRERLVDQRVRHAGPGAPQLDRDDVVGYPAAVREAGRDPPPSRPEDALLGGRGGRDRGVSAGACRPAPFPVKFGESRDDPVGGWPGEQGWPAGSARGLCPPRPSAARRAGTRRGTGRGSSAAQAGDGSRSWRTACRPTAAARFHWSLCPERGSAPSLTSGLPSPRHLPEGGRCPRSSPFVGVPQPDPLAARRGPHADGRGGALLVSVENRHLDRDRVHVSGGWWR